ncbi:Squalene monooxygenase SE1 [Camellia lanceoleosa]|uniref:Squalene monooxygenase SE1 n=1 Tax=Camellia lanceoleosa TaxID=1840588 RepID=A0ACC0FI08_9ERIC|nr:Squalene monooxygenase SE1 [Camellia lanceoleosa]
MKTELKLFKERESETDVALVSLNTELHKNMLKMAKAKAATAGNAAAEAVARTKSTRNEEEVRKRDMIVRMREDKPTLAQILSNAFSNTHELGQAVAFTVNTTAGALIKVNHSEAKDEIQEPGFEHLRLGQFFCRGPVGVISGVDLHPLNMAFYAFAVALYITCRSLLPIPSPKALWAAARLILDGSII